MSIIIGKMKYEILTPTTPDDYEVAAISAALMVLLSDPATRPMPRRIHRPNWHDTTKLYQQGLRPARTGVHPRWGTIERLRRRAAGGFFGIAGL